MKHRNSFVWANRNGSHKTIPVLHVSYMYLCEPIAIGFNFTSDWLWEWHEIFKPAINQGSNAKPKQFMRITFTERSSENCFIDSSKQHMYTCWSSQVYIFISKSAVYKWLVQEKMVSFP